MKGLIGIVFSILAALLHSIGCQLEEHSSIRTFQYRPAVHTDMKHLMRKVDGKTTGFNAVTTLVARSATVFGWLNDRNVIEPIFMRSLLVTYNIDKQVPSVASMPELEAYGVNRELPIGPFKLDPIRTFQYRPQLQPYLAFLRTKVDGQEVEFDGNTILVARGAYLFGWLNHENVIGAIFLRKRPIMYNLDEHMPLFTNVAHLISYGLFNEFPGLHSNGAQPEQTGSRSSSRSPQNGHRVDDRASA